MATITLTSTFAVHGSYLWTAPAHVTSVTVACTGGGGGAGSAAAVSGDNGGGGGGGEAAVETSVAVTPAKSYAVTVGAGGAGGTQGGNGSAGASSSFTGDGGVTCLAHGGGAGLSGTATAGGAAGAGGTGSTATVSAAGGSGAEGTPGTSGGGGGGAAGASASAGFPGNRGSGSTGGAASVGTWPGGAGGNGGSATFGANGSGPGGGGGGGESGGSNKAGGNGADGQVVVTWTMTDPVTLVNDTAGSVTTFAAPLGTTGCTAEAWGAGGGGGNPSGAGSYLIGATIGSNVYGTNQAAAITHFNQLTSLTLGNNVSKIYINEASWPTTVSSNVQAVINAGAKLVLCVKPSRTLASSEQTNLTNYLNMITAATTITPDVVLWQEPQGKDSAGTPFFATAALYQAYVNFYAPTVRAVSLPIAYCPLVGTGLHWDAYGGYPGDQYTDKILCDFYGTAYDSGVRLDAAGKYVAGSMIALADSHTGGPIPIGLGEWNANAGGTPLTPGQWNTYVNYLITLFQARINAGKPLGDMIFWMGNNAIGGSGVDLITSTSDFKIPGLQNFYQTLKASAAFGGGGGGGGEYAKESSLAISGLKPYTIVVGAGNAGVSGTNSTIAGDSVTVTAHGGGTGTSSGTGGTGGSGSANSTHQSGGNGGGAVVNGGGGGGGGSGGTGSAGSAGSAGGNLSGGSGAQAVTGGGPGGNGGAPPSSGQPPPSGPGGGGGGASATGASSGAGFDGQITLSSFTSGTQAAGGLALAPLALSGTGTGGQAGAFSLAPVTLSGTGAVGGVTLVQVGTLLQAGGSPFLLAAGTKPGTSLICKLVSTGQTALSFPANWQLVAGQNTGGASGRAEMWLLPGQYNPGGITSVAFTGGTNVRGNLTEWSTPINTSLAVDTSGTNSGGTGVTSFSVSTSASAKTGDLVTSVFLDEFSPAPSSTFGSLQSGWVVERVQQVVTNSFRTKYQSAGATAGVQTATDSYGTSTNQVGWAAIIGAFNVVAANATSGALALGPLALSGTANSTIPAGTVIGSGSATMGALQSQSPSLAITFPEEPLPITVEIQINGTWADITPYVYYRDGISINRGRPNEATTAQSAQVTLTLDNRDGSFSPQNTAGQFYPYLVRNGQIRISVNAVTSTGANYGTDGNGYRFWGQVPAWPPLWNPAATDVYVQITAVGVLQRMLQSKYSASPMARYYTNIINNALNANPGVIPAGAGLVPAGYWPCEDNINSASFASGLPGGSPMTWTGTPFLAGDSTAPGSAAIAQLNGSTWTGTPGAFTSGGITFGIPGKYTWTCPADVTSIKVECWGGGGGGADGIYGTGGAGGEYARESSVAVTPGHVYNLTVGSGGSGARGAQDSSAGGPGAQPTTGGTKSTFTGDTKTVIAHGGQGGQNSNSGTANGGSGSNNTTNFPGGNGGASGRAALGGSSGGSSGGSGGPGNNGIAATGRGGTPGAGAVPGGGPGGNGGGGQDANGGTSASGQIPFPGPGGGGGGGGFNSTTHYGRAGGGGQNGQVALTYVTSTHPPANVIRAVIDMQGGGTTGAQWLQAVTSGTVHFLNLTFQGSGTLQLRGRDVNNNLLFDSGAVNFGVTNGSPLLVSVELFKTPLLFDNVSWKLTAITPGATSAVATATGSLVATIGSVSQVNVNNFTPDTQSTGIGHISVQYQVDPILNLSQAFNAYIGETAEARFLRLCTEQNVPVTVITSQADSPLNPDTPAMGPQPTDLLVNLLQDCENTDLGQMFEQRSAFGLGYITRVALQNQPATAILDYSRNQLGADLTPTDDEQLLRNDVVVTRGNGGFFNQTLTTVSGNRVIVPAQNTGGTSYEFFVTTGPLSVLDPPNGVGLYQYQVTVNVQSDSQLAAFAQWLLTLGTLDEYRYPTIVIDLMRPAVRDGTFGSVPNLDIGSMITINNPPSWLPQYPINQLCYGFTERLNAKQWTITINAVPADPYISTSSFPDW